jgi:hypothetical protein
MNELDDFKAGKESRAGVVSRAGRPGGSADAVQRMVDAAFYRETHQKEPKPSTEDTKQEDDG